MRHSSLCRIFYRDFGLRSLTEGHWVLANASYNYYFGDFPRPVKITDCPELVDGLRKTFLGWNIRQKDCPDEPAPIIKIYKPDNRYLWLSDKIQAPDRWAKNRPTTVPSVVADFHYRFYDWYTLQFPQHLCLHCAAVEIAGGLVVFPNVQKVGKSTLTTRLAMAGKRVFCDDVLAYCPERNLGLALGILPRVRLPLPDVLPSSYKEYIDQRIAVGSRHYAYVQPDKKTFAEYGETLPIHAVVKLERDEACGKPELTPLSRPSAISAILHQNFVVETSANEIFDQVLKMLGPCKLLTMRYSNLDDGAEAIVDAIENGCV